MAKTLTRRPQLPRHRNPPFFIMRSAFFYEVLTAALCQKSSVENVFTCIIILEKIKCDI